MYEIKVLMSNEFDSLPKSVTRGSDISDSLGFADPETGKAYVRYSNYPDLQKFLVNHELEELMADESTHEDENGIRHKKFFKQLLMPMLSMGLGAIGGATGLPGGAQMGSAIGSGINNLVNKPKAPSVTGLPSGMGQGFGSSSPVQAAGPTSTLSGGINQPSQQGMGRSPLLQFGETDPEKNQNMYGYWQGRDPNRFNL